jgi:hypothetical protein
MAVGIKGVEDRGMTAIKNEVYIRSFSSFPMDFVLDIRYQASVSIQYTKTQRIL